MFKSSIQASPASVPQNRTWNSPESFALRPDLITQQDVISVFVSVTDNNGEIRTKAGPPNSFKSWSSSELKAFSR